VEPLDPYQAPQAENDPGQQPLGSLAQAARGKEIKQAQWILIIIGLMLIGYYSYALYNIPREVDQVIQQANFDPAQIDESRQFITWFCYAIYGGLVLLGVLFFVFGLIIKSYPVPITITSLILYILYTIGVGLLDPTTIFKGLLIKFIFIVGLFKAVKAARAYESETKEAIAAGYALE
jgi:hypothetical protein